MYMEIGDFSLTQGKPGHRGSPVNQGGVRPVKYVVTTCSIIEAAKVRFLQEVTTITG